MHKVRGDPEKRLLMLIAAVFTALIMFGSRSVFASELGTDPLPEETAVVETIPEETAVEPAPDPVQEMLPPEETALEPAAPVTEPTEPAPTEELPPEETALEPADPATEPAEPAPEGVIPTDEAAAQVDAMLPVNEEIVPAPENLTEPVTEPDATIDEALPAEEAMEMPVETAPVPESGAGLDVFNVEATELVDPAGYVYDAVSKAPITGATVTLYKKIDGGTGEGIYINYLDPNPQVTLEDGHYSFLVGVGDYRLEASKEGYVAASAEFTQESIIELPLRRIDFYLLPTSQGWICIDGDVQINQDLILPGTDIDLTSANTDNTFKSITLLDNKTISTRVLAPGETDLIGSESTASSGDVSMTAPIITIKSGARILTHTNNEFLAGAILMTAMDTKETTIADFIPSVQIDKAETKIEIGENTVIRGGDITLVAKSDNEYVFPESVTEASLVEKAVTTGIDMLQDINLLAAVAVSDSDASITVGKGSEISGNTFTATAKSYTNASTSPIAMGVGVSVGVASSNAYVVVHGSITTEGDCYLNALSDNTLQVVGSASGIGGVSFAVAVSVLNSDATVHTSDTSTLNVGGNLTLLSETVDRNVTLARSKTGDSGKVGMAVAVSYENGTTNSLLDGNATVAGDMEVRAYATKDAINMDKMFGQIPSTSVGVCAQTGVNTTTFGNLLDDYQGTLKTMIMDKAKVLFGKVKDLVKKKSDEQQTEGKKTQSQTSAFELAAAVAVYLDINTATARIGLPLGTTFAVVKTIGSATVNAIAESQPYVMASGAISETEKTAEPQTEEEKKTEFAGSAAVAIGIFTNNAYAFIADNASVDSAHDLVVKAESLNDFEFMWGKNIIQELYKTYLALGGSPTYKSSEGWKMVYTGDVILVDHENATNGTPGNYYMYVAEVKDGMVVYGQTMDLKAIDFTSGMWFDLGSLEQVTSGDGEVSVKTGDVVEVLEGHAAGGEEGHLYKYLGEVPASINLTTENYANELLWEDMGADWQYRGGELVRTFSTYLDSFGYDNNFVNTWTQSTAKGANVSICGAVSVIDLNGTAEAYIGSNAKINQLTDTTYRTGLQKVSVSSMVVNEAIHLGGNIEVPGLSGGGKSLKIKGSIGGTGVEAEGGALGGTVIIVGYDNVSTAIIEDGVVLYADALDVSADTSSFSFSFSASGGTAGTFAFNGTFSIIDINNKTWAGIENGARIVIGDYGTPKTESVLRIHAKDTSFIINLTGGIATSNSIGIGASIAIDEITRDTRAFIGNELLSATSDGKPGEAEFTVIANGPVTIEAKNDGFIFSLALAAAVVKEKTPDPNKPAEPKSESKFGLGISAEVVINEMGDTAVAFIHDASLKGVSLAMKAGNRTLIIGAGGSMSIVTTKGTSVGLAGSFAYNDITNVTKSLTDNSNVVLTGSYDSSADGSERIISICASGSASTSSNSASIAGQVSINTIGSQTAASIINLSDISANNVILMSKDNSLIFSIAGALAYGGKGGVGVSIAFNDVPALGGRNYTAATIEASDVKAAGFLDIDAETKGKIIAITAALGASKEGMAGALSVSVNTIIGDTKVFVSGKKTLGQDIEGAVTMDAIDDSYIFSLAGSLAASDKASFGIALSYNEIDKVVTAYLLDTKLDAASLAMKSSSDATIVNITAGGAVAKTLAAGGSVSVNNIGADTETYIRNSEVGTLNSITLEAKDDLKIGAIAGTVAGAGKAAFGLAIATNNIGSADKPTNTRSYIENSKVVSTGGGLTVSAIATSVIKNLTGAGTIAGDAGISGAASINNIYSLIEAFIKDCGTTERYVRVMGDLILKAEDHSTVSIISATLAVSGKVSAGAAVGTVNIGTLAKPHVISANIDNSKAESTGGKAELTAKADAVIFNFTAGIAVGGNAGAQGSVSVNNVRTNTGAEIRNNSVVNARTGVSLKAHASNRDSIPSSAVTAGEQDGNTGSLDMESDDDSEDDRRITTIQSLAGAVAGGGSGSIGAAVATNDVRMNVNAAVVSSTVTSSDGQISIEAISEASIETLSAAIVVSNYVSVAAGVSLNKIENDTNAYIKDSTVTANYVENDPQKVSGVLLVAKDTSSIIAVAGQVNVAVSGGGLGAAAAFNEISNEVRSHVENSTITSKSSLLLVADSDSEIKAIAAGGGFGLYVSLTGSVAKNTIANSVFASIYSSTVTADKGVYLDSVNSSSISALAGALSTSAYAAIGGSVAINNIGCRSAEADDGYVENDNSNDNGTKVTLSDIATVGTKSWIENSRIISGSIVKLHASTDSMIKSISAAGGGALVAVNGSISMNNIYMDTESYIKGCIDTLDPAVKLVRSENDIWIEAYDNSAVSAIAGNVSIGAVGAGAAVSTVNIGDGTHVNRTRAYIDSSSVTSVNGSINLKALTNSFIFNIAAGVSIGGTGIQGSVAVNNVTARTSAEIVNGSKVTAENSVTLMALIEKRETIPASMLQADGGEEMVSSFDGNADDDDGTDEKKETSHSLKTIQSIAGSVAGGGSAGLGASVATNNVKNTVEASITKSVVKSIAGNVILEAKSEASIETVSAAIAGGGSYALAAAVSLNWIRNSISAFVSDSRVTSENASAYVNGGTVPGITISAKDTSVIRSVAGQVSIGGSALGAGAAYNEIGSTVKAYADTSSVLTSKGSILLIAKSDATIETIAAGGSLSSGASVAGSAVINILGNDTEAYMDHSTADADGNVHILADSQNTINAFGGALAGGAIGVGAVAVVNDVENTTLAYSSHSDIKARGKKEELDVKSWDESGAESLVKAKGLFIVADCDDKVTVYSGSVSIAAGALSGQLSVTVVSDTTKAYIVASTINSLSEPGMWVKVKAHQGTDVDVRAGGLTIGTVAVGAAVDHTNIKNTTYAYIDKDSVTRSAVHGQDIEVTTDTLEDVDVVVAGVSLSASMYISVSVSGSVSVALVDCDNRAYVADSDVTALDKLSILANDVANVSSTSYLLAASTFAGAGGTVSVNTLKSSTIAESKGGNLKAYGAMEIRAAASDKVVTVLGTMGVGGAAGLAGAVSVNTIETTTEANVMKGATKALINKDHTGTSLQTVKVSATNTSTIDGKGGSLGAGIGAGIGATVDVAAIRNRVVASVGLETEIYASGDITIEAISTKHIYSKVSSMAGGLLGVSGAVSVISIGEAMDETAGDEFAITNKDGDSLMTQVSGDTKIGSMGLGSDGTSIRAGSMLSTMEEPDIAALVGTAANTEGKVTAAFIEAAASSAGRVVVKAGGKLTVKADSIVSIEASMDNLALGAYGIGAVVAAVRTNERTSAFIGDYADILAGSLLIMAESDESALAEGKAATGGFLVGITANIADVSIKPTVKAYIGSNAYVFSKGDAEIAAIVTPKASAVVQGTTASGGVSVGVSSSTAKAEPDVSAWIGDYSRVMAGTIFLNGNPNLKFSSSAIMSEEGTLTFKDNYVETTGTMTFAQDAVNGDTITRSSGSWIADGYKAEDGIVVVRGTQTTQYIIHSLTAETLTLVEKGAVAAGAEDNVKVYSDRPDTITRSVGSWGTDGFEAGQAIVVAGSSLNNGAYEIREVTETELILMQNYGLKYEVNAGASVTADTNDRIRRGSGNWYGDGFRAGQEIRVSGTASNDGTYIIESVSSDGKYLVLQSKDRLTVEVTAAAAFVVVDPEEIKPQLTVSAIVLLPDNGSGITANADAKASSGALLIGVSSTDALASTTSLVNAYTGTGVRVDAAGIAEINAYAYTSQKAIGTSNTGGIVAKGGNTARAESTGTISAYTGTGLRIAADELRITAFGDEKNLSDSTAGTGGLVAGSAAKAETSSTSTTRAEIGNSAERISLIGLLIYADHTSRFDGKVDSTSASLLGFSGAEAINSVNAGVTIKIGDVTIPAYNIVATAINSSSKDYIGGSYNAWSGSGGGLVDVPATRSLSTIIHTTGIEVADGASLEVIGDKYYPGSLALSALNSVYARDKVRLVSSGAIALAKASSKVETIALTAYVTVGNADLKSVGDIDLSARTMADMITDTFVHTSGGAGAAQGDSRSFVKAVNTITLNSGADLFSEGEVNLLAGANSSGEVNTYNLKSMTYLENYTAFPVNTNPDAVAGFDQTNNVTVNSGALVKAVKDANLIGETGITILESRGTGKDYYRSAIGAEIRYESTPMASTGTIRADGEIHVGIRNKQRLIFDSEGNVTEKSDGITFTKTRELLSASIIAELERLQLLKEQYAGTEAGSAFAQELDFRLAELTQQGYTVVITTSGSYTYYSIDLDVYVDVIRVDDIWAQSSNINVIGTSFIGTGKLSAPGDAEIIIQNSGPAFLIVNRLTIPETEGGYIRFNGTNVTGTTPAEFNLNLNNLNRIKAAAFTAVTSNATSAAPKINVVSSYNGSLRKPDITLLGTISNIGVPPRFGDVLITSTGSVYVRSDINAGTLNISASASMVQSYKDTFINVGGEVRVHYSSMATRQQNITNSRLANMLIPISYPQGYAADSPERTIMNSLLAGILSVANRQDAKLSELRAANIFIAARYLNVNGLIEAGHATQSAYLAGSIDAKIQTYKNGGLLSRNYLDYPLVQISDMKFYYDPVNDRILLDDVSVRGGYVELFGQIISTGTGRIKALDGFGTISVVNETLYSLAIKALDVGIGSHGTIKITDTSKQTKIGGYTYYQITKYTRAYDTGTGKYTVTVKTWWSNTSEDAATTVITNIADASTTSYQPTVGYRYVYVLGQDSGIKETYTYATSSWAGIDWLAKDPGSLYSYVYQTYGTPVPLENGEYLDFDTANSSVPYMYWYESITQSSRIEVSRRQWTTSGGFLGLKKTYWTEVIYRTYVKNVHYNSVKADYPIAIEFAGGLAGNISIVSDEDIVIMGPVTNVLGTTKLEAGGSITQTSTTAIASRDIELLAGTGIGNGQSVHVELKGGNLKAVTDEGDISILEITGTLKIAEVSTGDGKVWLTAQTGIVAASSETLVKGDFISLNAGSGGIGSGTALRVDTGTEAGSGMIAKAEGSINLKEIDGDMFILGILSKSGNVSIEAVSGSLADGDETEKQGDNEGVLVVLRDNVTAGNLMDQWTAAGITASSDSKYTPSEISTLLAYALHKRLTDTEYRYELVNISGQDITLKAADGIGNLRTARIDFNEGKALLTEETMLMLAAAERGDVRFYDANDDEVASESASTAYIIITIHDDLDIISTGKLTVIAGGDSCIGSEEDIRIMTMTGQDTRIRSAKGIQSALGTAGQNIVCGSLVIEAGNGDIGTEAKPIGVTAVSAGTERLAARSSGNIWLKGIESGADNGSFNLDFIYTPGSVNINADGWIKDAISDGNEKIVGQSLVIYADSVGEAGGTLETDLLSGNMEIHAANGGIYVEELNGGINALVIGTSTGDVMLKAEGSILDVQAENGTKSSNILGRNIKLTATNGSIGTAGNHLEIDSANGGAGRLDADSKLDMFIDELTGSLSLGKLRSDSRIFISAPGAIVNAIGLTSGCNAEGLSLSFAAGGSAGTEAAPILMKVSELAGDAAGDVWIINDGALTVKGIEDGKRGIDADEKVQITVRSPFTLESYIFSAGDTIIRTNDSASGDGITIAALAVIDSEGRVVLLSGDDIHILKTSKIEAVGEVVLFGDFNGEGYTAAAYSYTGDPDKGTGAAIEILELPKAPSIKVYGGDDNDSFILTVDEASGAISMYGKGGSDSFTINRLPSLKSKTDGILQDTLTLDGEGGADTYTININNGQDVHNIINVWDTGTDSGDDKMYIFGTEDPDVFLLREKFIAILHADGVGYTEWFERINYDNRIEALEISTLGGDDRFYSDDNSAFTKIYSGAGDDFFQVGQMFATDRVVGDESGILDGDQIKTVHTTRGYLTPGNSFDMELYGGDGNDSFSVYANMKPLRLEGEDGNDRFILRAFALADPDEPGQALMNVDAGTGDDYIEYNINAPVTINGGDGYDTVIAVGTEFADVFIVTSNGICGAGLNITIEGAEESFEAYGMEGDDIFHVQSTRTGMVTRLVGGLGSDVFNLMGDVTEHVSSTGAILKIVPHNLNTIQGPLYLEGFNYDGAPDFTLKSGVGLPYEISLKLEDPEFTAVDENAMKDRLYAFNDGTTLGTTATLTADNLSGLGMGGSLTFNEGTELEPVWFTYNGGVTYTSLEIVEIMLGSGIDNFTITDTAAGTMTAVHGGGGEDTMTINGNSGPLVVYGDTSEDGSRYSGTLDEVDEDMANAFDNPGIDTIDASLSSHGLTIYGGPGNDIIHGSQGPDNIAGGSGADEIYGEEGNDIIFGDSGINADLEERTFTVITTETASGDTLNGGAGNNIIFGDHGYITYDGMAQGIHKVSGPGTIVRIESTSIDNGGDDIMTGGDDAEILIGGPGADKIYGNGGDDVMLGDHGRTTLTEMLVTIESHVEIDGDVDIMTGDLGADIMMGGTGGDDMTGGAGSNVMIGDHGTISRAASAGEKVFGTAGVQSIMTSLEEDGGDDIIAGGDDDDVLMGGSGTDTIFGNAGDDFIAGDNVSLDISNEDTAGNRYRAAAGPVYLADGRVNVGGMLGYPGDAPFWFGFGIELNHLGNAGNDDINGGAGEDMIFGQDGNDNIDGDLDDDYIEGGSGADTIYGGPGQDDIIGGSSDMFGYELAEERSDGSDTIFGGEGTDTGRNTYGDGTHANDADVILGDNGNIYRLVDDYGYLTYGYDTYEEIRNLIPRVAKLLDYTPGGPDYYSAASGDIGDADTIHGEGGDDTIYGMKGNDILYGDAGDDDIIGGWGHDWISGGTGDDGVLGDDGRICTSRNGIEEPLYGIGVNAELYIEGTKSMTATIYKTGAINKTANLYPFNVDVQKDPFYDPQHADDIIYGGLGNDFLHGGSGDDAISGAEALEAFYYAPSNIGNVLGYDAKTTLFAAYNPKAPMARVMVDQTGKFVLTGGTEFLMNFDTSEPDGNDMIFGDLGNDWLVGGPGMDWMFGGLGDDLLNADDDHNPMTDNTEVDFAPTDDPTYYDDILFGGGGRDILIASSTGDVMVDWTGEYNSYVVPTSNFGPGTVIRYSTKDIVKFLYDLSEGAGADTDAGTYITGTDPARNSEPYGELGLVLTGDPFAKDLVGAPRDPQPGNKGGKK